MSAELDEMPPGRKPIETTRDLARTGSTRWSTALARHLAAGEQAYWVCPLVEESEKSDLAAAEERAAMLRARFGDEVGLVHGRMKGPEKDAVMARFAAGELGVLVATTVIEVGVDVPNATLIVIEHADRFGLAQLHQLRGRVGRGGGQVGTACCCAATALSETARARLALMRETNDGFLHRRGGPASCAAAGELLGTRQSGEQTFRLATPEQSRRADRRGQCRCAAAGRSGRRAEDASAGRRRGWRCICSSAMRRWGCCGRGRAICFSISGDELVIAGEVDRGDRTGADAGRPATSGSPRRRRRRRAA